MKIIKKIINNVPVTFIITKKFKSVAGALVFKRKITRKKFVSSSFLRMLMLENTKKYNTFAKLNINAMENYDAYYDFGVVGVFVFSLILGIVSKIVIDVIKKNDNPIVYLFYGQFAIYLMLAFFTTWFSSPATWFWLIVTGVIYWYVGFEGNGEKKR